MKGNGEHLHLLLWKDMLYELIEPFLLFISPNLIFIFFLVERDVENRKTMEVRKKKFRGEIAKTKNPSKLLSFDKLNPYFLFFFSV